MVNEEVVVNLFLGNDNKFKLRKHKNRPAGALSPQAGVLCAFMLYERFSTAWRAALNTALYFCFSEARQAM